MKTKERRAQRMDLPTRFCSHCGSEITGNGLFCTACGSRVATEPVFAESDRMNQADSDVSASIQLSKDGKLRWVYEFNLYRNPTILLLLLKIFFFIVLGIYLFMIILTAFDDGLIEAVKTMWPVFLYPMLFIVVLISFSYLLYALIMGGKYCVLFEMDEKGINHIQLPKQFKKARIVGLIATLAGAAGGNPGTMGAGLLAASRQSMYSAFKKIRSVKPYRRRQVIKLRSSDLMHNQIYADVDDFDFVLNYIQTRVASTRQARQA